MIESTPSRIVFLRERLAVAERAVGRTTFDVPFRQRQISLVRIDVPIGFPLYNVRSGRTHRAQTEWIEQHGQRHDFFADPEDEEVQRVQRELLEAMVGQEGLDEDLERRDQRNPIVLTYDGCIVDGNRRVAALLGQGRTENVMAVVLPEDATALEVFETELELQMARETRAQYNWVDQGLHVRYGISELGEQVASVANRMNVSQQIVEEILARMSLVDLYLEWLGTPDAYHRVPHDSEQSFRDLAQREASQQFRSLPERVRRAIRYTCFGVIQSEDGGYMDVRRVADAIRSQPFEVVARVRERLPNELAERLDQPITGDESGGDDNLLAQLVFEAEEPLGASAGAELLNVVADPVDARSSVPIIMEIASDLAEEGREAQTHLEPLRKVERVLRMLQSIRIGEETRRLDEVTTRLADVIAEAERLAAAIAFRAQ